MKVSRETKITWTQKELSELIKNENSRVYFKKTRKHLALIPYHLDNLNNSLHEILSSSLNKYDFEIDGLPLAYRNPKVLNESGTILYDSYFIHIDIEADFYVFNPQPGCVLEGVINKKAQYFIGVLVHKTFNVSISSENVDDGIWLGSNLNYGQKIKFQVTFVDLTTKLPYIRAKLLDNGETTVESLISERFLSESYRQTLLDSGEEEEEEEKEPDFEQKKRKNRVKEEKSADMKVKKVKKKSLTKEEGGFSKPETPLKRKTSKKSANHLDSGDSKDNKILLSAKIKQEHSENVKKKMVFHE